MNSNGYIPFVCFKHGPQLNKICENTSNARQSSFDHSNLDVPFSGMTFGGNNEMNIYGLTAADGMGSHMNKGVPLTGYKSNENYGSQFSHGFNSQLDNVLAQKRNINSCWEPHMRDQKNKGSIDPFIDLHGKSNSTGSPNNTLLLDSSMQTKSSGFNTTFESDTDTNADNLKLELQLKETQIESLESEIKKLKSVFNQGLTFKQQEELSQRKSTASSASTEVEIPANLEIIFLKLSESLKKKDKELQETKDRLESIITAVALNPTNATTKFGRYDEEALAHKMVIRLESLTKENQEMARMLSYGRVKERLIELEIIKKENEELKKRIKILEEAEQLPSN